MNRTAVEEIKARIPIEELIGSYVKIEKSGKSYKARCPFHNEKTPSFFISPDRGGYFCFGCFPPGQLVKTPFGYHPIETLDANHFVYSSQGNIRKIIRTMHREYKGKLVNVETQKLGGTVSLTSDHMIPVVRPKTSHSKKTKQFYRQMRDYELNKGEKIICNRSRLEKHAKVLDIPAGELQVGDFVMYPIPTAVTKMKTIDLSQYISVRHNKGPRVKSIPYIIPVNSDLLKLIGYYVAEGSNHRAYIRFSLGNHEEDLAKEIVRIIESIFGLKAKIFRRNKGTKTGLEITACHAHLANIFENLCGKGSVNKHIPYVFQELPFDLQMVLVDSVKKGDGHAFIPSLSKHTHNCITVVSDILVDQISDILLRNEFFPAVYSSPARIDKNGLKHKKTFSVKWSETAISRHELVLRDRGSTYWLLPVKKVSSMLYVGPVYNLTVDEDHTFVSKNFAVSNCGAKGDIFSFVEQFEGLDFKGALKVLAERAGVKLEKRNDSIESDNDKLFKITEEATKYFEEQYGKSKEAQAYVKGRGVVVETRQAFRIGWAPLGWQNLLDYLKKKGWQESFIEKAGFIKKSDPSTGSTDSPQGSSRQVNTTPRYYDRFRGRIIFPITDSSGRVVAFTGRILHDDGKSAKYLNSPETPIFTKSQILFGLDKAKSEIRRLGYSILVEGQMDLILSHQVGVKNTVASSGTALTDQAQGESGVVSNLGLVRRLSPNMIIALDSDKAGRTATMRAVAATALSMGMSVKIADAVADGFAGKDPADLILSNPENWKTVLKNAKHVIEFELGNIIRDVEDSRLLAKAVRDRVFPFLVRIDSEMDKAYFVKIIAEKAMLNEQAVWEDLRKFEKANKQSIVVEQGGMKFNSPVNGGEKKTKRFDLVERRLFGLLHLMENSGLEEVKGYREKVKKICGDSYKERTNRLSPILDDLSFEAESLYGDNSDKWKIHIKELLINFEEDLINEELIITMGRLRIAEKEGNTALVAEMAKKCQALSIRKGEVGM